MSQIPPPLPNQSSPYSSPPVPPTIPGELGLGAPPPSWPKVVGIISIVWGGLGSLCAGCGILSAFSSNMFAGMMPPEAGPMPDAMKPGPVQIVLSIVGLGLAIWLIVAGVMTLQRKIAGRTMHLVYACISILVTIAAAFAGYQQQMDLAAWAKQNPDSVWAQSANSPIGLIMLLVATLLGLAYPIFCLVWFGAVKKTVASFGLAADRDII